MRSRWTGFVATVAAFALVAAASDGQDERAPPPAVQAERLGERLLITAQHFAWEEVTAFGLIQVLQADATSLVQEDFASQQIALESSPHGFRFAINQNDPAFEQRAAGALSITLASGQTSAALITESTGWRRDTPEFMKEVEALRLRFWDPNRHLKDETQRYREAYLSQLAACHAAGLNYHLDGTLTFEGAPWEDVQTLTLHDVKGTDHTSDLQAAITRGLAWVSPTENGFVLEIQDSTLLDPTAREVVLRINFQETVTAPIRSSSLP